MKTRRTFLRQTGAALTSTLLLPTLPGCEARHPLAHIKGQLLGANAATGHLLRDPSRLPPPTRTMDTEVLIIGGGVAGLAARRWLHRHGQPNTLLVELAGETGGNAAAGRNEASAYPWGAHYLPVPDVRNRELLDFLQEAGTLTGYAPNGLPIYSDYHLCHDPEERLNISGHWQEGLVPTLGLAPAEQAEFARFFRLID
ncbi:MAG TPA: FAD/NAD(P)-binding protein, partial [Hymenobacter sp.]